MRTIKPKKEARVDDDSLARAVQRWLSTEGIDADNFESLIPGIGVHFSAIVKHSFATFFNSSNGGREAYQMMNNSVSKGMK